MNNGTSSGKKNIKKRPQNLSNKKKANITKNQVVKKQSKNVSNTKKVKKNMRNNAQNNIQNNVRKNVKKNNVSTKEKQNTTQKKVTKIPKERVVDETEYIERRKNVQRQDNYEYEPQEETRRRVSPKLVLIITFVIGIIVVCAYSMFNLEYFNLQNVEVVGNTKYEEDKIIENTTLVIGKNIFTQLITKDYNKSELPYVSKLGYSYSFPNTIVIQVEERYPEYIAKDKNSDKYYMIDNQGYILEECTLEQKQDELLVEGLSFEENVEFGKKIDDVYIKKIEKFNEIKELLKEAEISTNITKVTFNASLTIINIDDKLDVVFSNDSNLSYKVSFLKEIIKKNGGIVEGKIDMSVENPVYSKYN